MARYTINISLSEKSVNEAIRQLQQYKNWLIKKTSQLVKELAEVGIPVIDENMAKANYTYDAEGIRSGSNTNHYTYVKLRSFGGYNEAILIVEGKELMFIEFGAGVFYNGEAGLQFSINTLNNEIVSYPCQKSSFFVKINSFIHYINK